MLLQQIISLLFVSENTVLISNTMYPVFSVMASIDPITRFFKNHKDLILFHRSLVIAGLSGLFLGAYVAQLYSYYDDSKLANALVVLVIEYCADIPIFVILLFFNNRKKYSDPLIGKKNKSFIIRDLQKLVIAVIASEGIYCVAKVTFHYLFLQFATQPYEASLASSIIGWASFFVVINVINKKFKLLKRENENSAIR